MITTNALINDCFQKCSLVGEGQAATGTQAMAALKDLMSVIAELNGQNLILTDVETVDITKSLKIRIMDKLPEGWHEMDERPDDLTPYQVGEIFKIGDRFFWVDILATDIKGLATTDEFNDEMKTRWPDLIVSPLPDRIQSLARKLGNRYVQLFPAQRQVLDSKTKMGLPTFFSCETQLEHMEQNTMTYDYEVFIIDIDSVQVLPYRITYLKSIPEYNLNDRLYFSERIISILEDGLCAKLCLRYKLTDVKPLFDEEYANAVALLKRSNNGNRPMTYDIGGSSYLDSFYNGLAPREW